MQYLQVEDLLQNRAFLRSHLREELEQQLLSCK